jgi:hypothetical protein
MQVGYLVSRPSYAKGVPLNKIQPGKSSKRVVALACCLQKSLGRPANCGRSRFLWFCWTFSGSTEEVNLAEPELVELGAELYVSDIHCIVKRSFRSACSRSCRTARNLPAIDSAGDNPFRFSAVCEARSRYDHPT